MRKLITSLIAASAMIFTASSQAAVMSSSTEFDAGSTIINFDELTTGTVVTNQYAGLGVTISGTSGSNGTGSSVDVVAQNWDPIYIGNESIGWDGSIIFDFSTQVTQFGLDIIDGYTETLSVYDMDGLLIESVLFSGYIGFVGIDTGLIGISKAIVSGNFYAVDDIGFNNLSPVPVPAAAWLFGSALLGFIGFSRKRKKSA